MSLIRLKNLFMCRNSVDVDPVIIIRVISVISVNPQVH